MGLPDRPYQIRPFHEIIRFMKTVDFDKNMLLAYSESSDGNIDYRFSPKKEVKANRDKIFTSLKLSSGQMIEGQQIHSNRILALNSENSKMWRGMNVTGVDGFVTDQKDIALMLRVADCVPVLLYDPKRSIISLVHAGWKGAVSGIHVEALAQMEKRYESVPGQVKVWLGPCIKAPCFVSEVEPDQIADPAWKPFIKKSKNHWVIDLPGYITASLVAQGINPKHIKSDPACTFETDSLYSFQKSKADNSPEGRFAVIAKINQ